jgi:hypothetical protein
MQTNLLFFFNFIILTISSFLLHQKFIKEPLGKFFIYGLFLKLFAGIAVVYVFRYRYGSLADSQNIFDGAAALANKLRENPLTFLEYWFITAKPNTFLDYKNVITDWTPQTVFMYKLTSLICLICGNNFWLVNLYLSFLSYLGLWLCGNSLAKNIQNSEIAAAIAFLFFPTVVVWSSGILKESLLWFLCGTMISITLSTKPTNTLQKLVFILLSICLFKLKYYYFAVLMAVIFIYIIGKIILQNSHFQQHIKKTLLLLGFSCILVLAAISNFHDNLRLNYFFEGLVTNYYYLVNNSDIDNLVYYNFTNEYFFSTLQNIPAALQSAWFLPMIWETESNVLKLAAATENTVILGLLVAVFIKFFLKIALNYVKKSAATITTNFTLTNQQILLLFCGIFYLLVLSVFIALATPNLGALVRYKVGYLPFAIYILLAALTINPRYSVTLSRVFRHL